MQIITTRAGITRAITQERNQGHKVGFVPTMGALHQGHRQLIRCSLKANEITVVSIFVNPTQFNNPNDLKTYPRTLENDRQILESLGVDYLFAPNEEEMYPEPDTRQFDFGQLATVMEGRFRPGHFNGVAQIVSKLFDCVQPHRAYFGEKDFQQLAIIQHMTNQIGYNIAIVPCPIVREPDGLAMSSRNQRLTKAHRQAAPLIYQTLLEARKRQTSHSVKQVKDYVVQTLNAHNLLDVEYFDMVDTHTLQSVSSWNHSGGVVGCIAVFAGEVRLIDNIRF